MKFLRALFSIGASAALLSLLSLPAAAAEGSFQRTLQVNGPVSLDIATGSGSIDVHPGSGNQVQVTGHIKVTEWFDSSAEERV
jgi:hypothetical protein